MKQYVLIMTIFTLFLGGCEIISKENNTKNDIKREVIIADNTGISEEKEINLNGYISSGINIPGYNIVMSGNNINYNNLFSINFPSKVKEWDFYNGYGEVLNMTDQNLNNLQITKYTIEQNSKCDFNFEEGVKKISKSTETIGGLKINLANALFYITGPDMSPTYSRQSFLCFTKDNSVYKIIISDDSKFRTDIIDSFKFIH